MDLAVLKSYLDGLGTPLVLRGDDANLGAGLGGLVKTMPAEQLTLDPAGGITIGGSTLTISGSSTSEWPVQGMSRLTLTLGATTLTVTAADVAGASLDATLPLAPSQSAAVTVKPGKQAGTWDIALAQQATNVTPTELIALGITGPLPFPVPAELNLLDQDVAVAPGSFAIRFAPNTKDDAYYTFKVSAAGGSWHLIPGVIDFTGLDLTAVITTTGWSMTIVGHTKVGSVGIDVGVQVNPGSTWSAYVAPSDGPAFPGIVDLAEWIAGAGLGKQTTEGFSNLGFNPELFDLALSRVTLAFTLSPPQVVSLTIGSRLTVVGLGLDLVLTLPQLTLAGSLAAGQPVKVVDMLTAAGISPAGVPGTLTIAQADFSADAKLGHYSTGVTVDGIWPTPPVKLDEITAAVDYSQGEGFTGSFGARIGVGTAQIGLLAAYAGAAEGWAFSGGTIPGSHIAIGDVLTELAHSFGISDVPAPITSLTLTNLSVSYKTGTGEFAFTCGADLTVESTPVAVVVKISVGPASQVAAIPALADGRPSTTVTGSKGYSATFTGQVTFGDLEFDLVFDVEDESTDVLVADYVHTGDPASTELRTLAADISPTLAEAIPPGIVVDVEEVKFVLLKQTATQWAFGLRLGTEINLNELPIVGSKLPAGETLAIENLQILYANAAMTKAQTDIINPLLPAKVAKLPEALGEGIAFEADVQLGSYSKHLPAGVTPPAAAPAAGLELVAGAAPPPSSTDPVKWLDVNKQFGIFSVQRVGAGYQNNVLEFALDASVALGPIAFSMQELTVGSPLTKFEPEFSLKGLALSFDRPPISIGGAFLKVPEKLSDGTTVTSYYGELMVSVTQFSLKALGGWAPDAHPASFFIYLSIDAPIGGPPFLFVTGIAGGFGINSQLTLPTIDEVAAYPLLPAAAPKEQASAAETIKAVIPALQHTFHPQAGEYWVAAGISFTSFEMIDAQAVVSVSFGVELQIGVVGTCSMSFPSAEAYPVAYVEIDVVASFTPSTGLLAVDGKLSPASYLYGGFVKLSGGFAFYAWFSGEHRGDFVVSLGGYHPAFDKPSNYPVVPRLQMSFALGPLKVVGQAYFALTPNAFMAGVRLSATFSAGPVKAWFDAGVDFLISWAPFHYEAGAWVTIGCSIDLGLFTISVQIGAQLQLWGPAFGGSALVDLDVVSFTIGFGAERALPPPVGWKTFSTSFLPPPIEPAAQPHTARLMAAAPPPPPPAQTNIIQATVTAGQIGTGPGGYDWILDPDHFRILTASTIPANHAVWSVAQQQTAELRNVVADYTRALAPAGVAEDAEPAPAPPAQMFLALDHDTRTFSKTVVWAPTLNIAPMNEKNVASYHVIALRKYDVHAGAFSDYVSGVTVAPQLGPSNTALWGVKEATPTANAQRLIQATLNGIAISPVPRHPDQVSDVSLLSMIFGESHETHFDYQQPVVDSSYTVASSTSADGKTFTIDVSGDHTAALQNTSYVLSSLTDPWVASQRATVLDDLRTLGFDTTASDDVHLTDMATTALTDWPGAARIGTPA